MWQEGSHYSKISEATVLEKFNLSNRFQRVFRASRPTAADDAAADRDYGLAPPLAGEKVDHCSTG